MAVNCAAIPEELLSQSCSAMKKGRSPVLAKGKPGKFELAIAALCSWMR